MANTSGLAENGRATIAHEKSGPEAFLTIASYYRTWEIEG
jgi:hypothetical protein